MSRPSTGTDKKLIRAARELLPETGCTGLNLRKVAAKARVNLGMFHYHFKTKEEFTRRVLEEVYEDLFGRLVQDLKLPTASPSEKLETLLFSFGSFVSENRSLLVALIRDVLNGNKEVLAFVQNNIGRHLALLEELIRHAAQERGKPVAPASSVILAMAVVNFPSLVTEILERTDTRRPFGRPLRELKEQLLAGEALRLRAALAADLLLGPPSRKPK